MHAMQFIFMSRPSWTVDTAGSLSLAYHLYPIYLQYVLGRSRLEVSSEIINCEEIPIQPLAFDDQQLVQHQTSETQYEHISHYQAYKVLS